MLRTEFYRIAKYYLTGIVNTGVHVTIAYCLVDLLLLNIVIGHIIAFISATVMSYIVNSLWTFQHHLSREVFYKFIITSLIGLSLTSVISYFISLTDIYHLWIIFILMITVTPITYLLHKYWSFKT